MTENIEYATITIAMDDNGLTFRFEGIEGSKTRSIAGRMLNLLKEDLKANNISYTLEDPVAEETVRERIERLIRDNPPI